MKLCLKDAYASSPFDKTYTYTFSFEEYDDLPAPLASSGVDVTMSIHGENGYVTCKMVMSGDFTVVCGRCAREFTYSFSSVTDKPVLKDDGEYDQDAVYRDRSLCFDVEEEAYARLCFEFPMAPLCREDCKGLCPVCGCDLNADSCTCDIRTVDPRLAVLKNLFDK